MFDLVVRNANLPDGREGVDIAVQDGRIVAVETAIAGAAQHPDRRNRPPCDAARSSIRIFIWTRRYRLGYRA